MIFVDITIQFSKFCKIVISLYSEYAKYNIKSLEHSYNNWGLFNVKKNRNHEIVTFRPKRQRKIVTVVDLQKINGNNISKEETEGPRPVA